MAGKIFISYRREDEQGYAVRLYERMSESFGKERLFFDVDSIPPGFDFVKYIEKQIGLSDIVLVVIGRNWLNASDEQGRRRLDNPEDFVRIEIESALKQEKHVVPILVQGVQMPMSTQLPRKMQQLARRNAFFATHVGFRAEADRLINALERMKAFIEADNGTATDATEAQRQKDAYAAEMALQIEPAAVEQDGLKHDEDAERINAAEQVALEEQQGRERADEERAAQDAADLTRAEERLRQAEEMKLAEEVEAEFVREATERGLAERAWPHGPEDGRATAPTVEGSIRTVEDASQPRNAYRKWIAAISALAAISLVATYVVATRPADTPPTNKNPAPPQGAGKSQISLKWTADADLDLLVSCPDGSHMSYLSRNGCGGNLLYSMREKNETVSWDGDNIPPGLYKISVSLYNKWSTVQGNVPFVLMTDLSDSEVKVINSEISDKGDTIEVMTFTIPSK